MPNEGSRIGISESNRDSGCGVTANNPRLVCWENEKIIYIGELGEVSPFFLRK